MLDPASSPVTDIEAMEARLRAAMLSADVSALDALLADDLVFTDHNGCRLGKADDLNAYGSGLLRFDRVEMIDPAIRVHGDAALVAVQVEIAGSYDGQRFEGAYAYTRAWIRSSGKWQIAAAHCSAIA